MNKEKNAGRLRELLLLVEIFALSLTLSSVALTTEFYGKEKKGQGDEEEDAQAKKKYMFELMKSWSFGYENYKNKQYAGAVKHFWKVSQLDTVAKFPKVYRYLGDSYFKLNNPDSAQVVFELGLEKYPKDAYLHRMVGFLKNQRQMIDEAIDEYKIVVEIEPDSKDDWKQLAALYVKNDEYEDAISAFEKVLEIDPNDAEAQRNLSEIQRSTGDVEGAIENKEKTREAQPENSQVRFELGKMYFDQENYENSVKRFQEFLTLVPNDVGAMEYIASSYMHLEKTRQAIDEFKKILKLQPDNKKVMAEVSRCYKELGSFRSASAYANKALAIDKTYGLGWIALGEAYEASAEACVSGKDGKVEFNDKLVYEIAAQQYERAKKDLAFKQDAQRHLNYLQAVLPTKEDKFMHKNEKKPVGECYSWIN